MVLGFLSLLRQLALHRADILRSGSLRTVEPDVAANGSIEMRLGVRKRRTLPSLRLIKCRIRVGRTPEPTAAIINSLVDQGRRDRRREQPRLGRGEEDNGNGTSQSMPLAC